MKSGNVGSSNFSFSKLFFYWSFEYSCCMYFVKFTSKYFMFFDAIINSTFFVARELNAIDYCMLSLYLAALLTYFSIFFCIWLNYLQTNSFTPFPICILFYSFFFFCNALVKISNKTLKWRERHLCLDSIMERKYSVFYQ